MCCHQQTHDDDGALQELQPLFSYQLTAYLGQLFQFPSIYLTVCLSVCLPTFSQASGPFTSLVVTYVHFFFFFEAISSEKFSGDR